MHTSNAVEHTSATRRPLNSLLVAAALLSAWPVSAWAYLDPNSGGFLFQLLFPIITAVGAALVFLRERIQNAVKRLLRRDRAESGR